MPHGAQALAGLGVQVTGQPLRGIRYLDDRHQAEARFRGEPGLGVRRTDLHAALAHRARQLGIRVLPVLVDGVRQDGSSVSAAGLRARYLAAADGLHSPIRRGLGLDRPVDGPRRHGLRRHFAVAPWSDCVEVHWSPSAEAYVTPLAPDLVGVAVLTSRRGSFEQHLAAFPALLDRLPTGAAGPVRGAGPMRQRVRARVAGRVLLVGDAAGYVDALTGEGLSSPWPRGGPRGLRPSRPPRGLRAGLAQRDPPPPAPHPRADVDPWAVGAGTAHRPGRGTPAAALLRAGQPPLLSGAGARPAPR